MTPTAVPEPGALPPEPAAPEPPASAPVRLIESIVMRVANDPLGRWQWAAVGLYVIGLFLLAGAAYTPLASVGVRAADCEPDSAHAAVQAWLHPEKYLHRALASIPDGADSPVAQCRAALEERLRMHTRLHGGGHGAVPARAPVREDCAQAPTHG